MNFSNSFTWHSQLLLQWWLHYITIHMHFHPTTISSHFQIIFPNTSINLNWLTKWYMVAIHTFSPTFSWCSFTFSCNVFNLLFTLSRFSYLRQSNEEHKRQEYSPKDNKSNISISTKVRWKRYPVKFLSRIYQRDLCQIMPSHSSRQAHFLSSHDPSSATHIGYNLWQSSL